MKLDRWNWNTTALASIARDLARLTKYPRSRILFVFQRGNMVTVTDECDTAYVPHWAFTIGPSTTPAEALALLIECRELDTAERKGRAA